MRGYIVAIAAAATLIAGCAALAPKPNPAALQKQATDAERGFAKSMADRNFTVFQSYLSDEAVFFTRSAALRGKQAVADFWKKFYDKPDAPFSWEPQQVEVLDSGTLAISFGPVRDPAGNHVANYQSIWRLEAPGVWRIIFDRGSDECNCAKPQ